MKKYLHLIFLISFLFLFESCSGLFVTGSRSFVKVEGAKFTIDGEPYYFAGTNLWYGCYLGSPGETGDRERLKRELDHLKVLGITNLRVLGASEQSEIKNSLKPAIQKQPGVYDEDLLKGLDFLLAEMGKRDMRAIIFLNNYWEWSGGMSQYNSWFTGDKAIDPEKEGWIVFMQTSANFYRNEEAVAHYYDYIKKIIQRENTVTGNYYYEDPTIMTWELANEPRPGWGEKAKKNVEDYYKWIDETAKYIHELDPNHLVTTGSEGTVGSLDSPEYFLEAHKAASIDYSTFHLWAKNWGWFDAKNIEGTYQRSEDNAMDYFNLHMKLARELNKPIVLEEFGMARDSEVFKPGSPTTARDKYFDKLFDAVYDSAASGAPVAGTNFWGWGGEGRSMKEDYKWRQGDPFTGDPPQEAQGLNSVFNIDSTTIKVLKEHADKMKMLREKQVIVNK